MKKVVLVTMLLLLSIPLFASSVLILNPNNGEKVIELKGNKGDICNLPIPNYSGYTFKGWEDNSGMLYNNLYVLDDGYDFLNAKWEKSFIEIILCPHNGSSQLKIQVQPNMSSFLPTPTKDGYKFKYWESDDGVTYEDLIIPTNDLVLHAKY